MPDDLGADLRTRGEEVPLWPDAAARADAPAEIRFTLPLPNGREIAILRNVSQPTLTVYRPDPAKANGVGVIVAPGGGWRILAIEHEGTELAHWLTERGYTAFLLKYRLMPTPPDPAEFAKTMEGMSRSLAEPIPAAKAPRRLADVIRDAQTPRAREAASSDGRAALALVRERAAEWGVKPDRIGMIGFSAGAFLTADVALEPDGEPLAFAAPIYGGETGGRAVPENAPPLFTVVAADDRALFKVVEGLYQEWSLADRPAEIHVFARGGHGFGMARQSLPSDKWTDLFEAWLADQGFA